MSALIRYSKVAYAKLYDRKTPVAATDLLNDRELLFFEDHEIAQSRVLTDRGTEYCGSNSHEYELYLATMLPRFLDDDRRVALYGIDEGAILHGEDMDAIAFMSEQ